MIIVENYKKIREETPRHVTIVVAAKTRTLQEIEEVVDAGVTDIGQNYVQEAEVIYGKLPTEKVKRVRWHMIGPLQKNKINKALKVFNVVQTVDSLELARAINQRADRKVSVYIEVNIGAEETKGGISPDKVQELIGSMSGFENLNIAGLMTMEPYFEDPEDARPYFVKMREIFEKTSILRAPNINIKILSMGMTNSYKVAIEEGANMVRIGTAIFGERI